MDDNKEGIKEPQSDVYVELADAGENQSQKGIIFSKGNSLKQNCEVVYEPHETILDPGIYSFDLFYEPDLTVDNANDNQETIESSTDNKIL